MNAKYQPKDDSLVHPSYAIDLVWHTHMCHPNEYIADCLKLMHTRVDHVPWPQIAQEEMETSYECTKKHWQQEYNSELEKEHTYGNANVPQENPLDFE